jgi:hypothetical protein
MRCAGRRRARILNWALRSCSRIMLPRPCNNATSVAKSKLRFSLIYSAETRQLISAFLPGPAAFPIERGDAHDVGFI